MVDCLPATGGGLAIPVIALALVLNAGYIMLGRIAEIAADALTKSSSARGSSNRSG
ncbi:hypothetical protein G3N18_05370 [Microbacterium sp. 2C]|uniref:hypothetical protein n=1 Tax=Microbacterium paulum TaxID=2707006 RepID=UPI0018C1E2D6|nr:hypothetical protein [Microbacterium paulum]MBG0717514.1 hypothetical protein [Microbacterium paulum]